MARLNESSAPTESIEILKRRFVRQNREIARVNSIQSLRIRSLESEVSHLLSENVSLREQTISLGQELERYEAAKMLHDGVHDIKAKLDSKLAELGSLVTDLGALPRRFSKLYDERADSTDPGHLRSSNLDWRRRATDAGYHAATEDGKLPVILEDKCYPRKTLDPQELCDIIHNKECSPRSPEIEEVVPVEKEEDRIHFGSPELPEGLAGYQIMDTDAEEIGALLPPTLETRKKRKPSPVAVHKTERAINSDAVSMHHDMNLSLKSGAKRKFMSEEAELFSSATTEDGDDDFQYSRTNHLQSPENQRTSIYEKLSPSKPQAEKKGGLKDRGSSKRKVLEPKSTNINAAAPKRDWALQDQKVQDKDHLQDTDWKSSTNGIREISNQKSGMDGKPLAHDTNGSVPEDDSVKHSAECQKSKQNPSSAAEMPQEEANSNALSATRPTRRQRSVVSYAEPNLRDKMRRPTSEFADAVTGGNPRRTSNIQSPHPNASDWGDDQINGNLSSKRSSYHFETIDDVQNLSSEAQEDIASKNPMTTVSQRKRKTLPANSEGPSVEATARTHSTRHRSIHSGQQTDNEASLENDIVQRNSASLAKSATRQSRRHSSNPRGQILASESGIGSTGEAKHDPFRVNPTDTLALGCDESMLARRDNTSLETEAYAQSMDSRTDVERAMVSGTDGRARRTGTRRRSMMI